ncbi:glycosyltransferase family 2 protein, partial [Buttiauxella noackiae]|uniref:glycosyltransferase family 2 protein n=1 Tax=Buttiauxella noackiae TaxID=82992 RepID=UPI0023530F05
MKLSIIIPCYNSAEFIEECLESVLPNIQSDMEVIVVNDGSTDNSNDIIIKIAHRYPDKNLIIINQDNAGLSAARNKGLSIASGEYISLLDSDDLFDQKFWSEVPHLLNDSSIDIIEFNAEQFENELSNIVEHIDCAVFSGKKLISSIEQLKPAFQRCKWYPWARVYKKSLFLDNNIEFPEGRLYEDMSTIPALYLKCKCIFGINKSLIWYRFHKK